MAHKIFNRQRETATAPGTSSFTLNGAVQGGQSFAADLSTGNTIWYAATNGTAWEVGLGTFTSPSTLARTTILESSNADAVVNFSSGTVDIFCDVPASVFDSLNMTEETIVSAGTTNIGALHAFRVAISGTTTITSLGTTPNKLRHVRFTGAMKLSYNASSLILPGAQSLITTSGDTAIFASDSSGNWRCLSYLTANGFRLKAPGGTFTVYTNYSTGSDATGDGTSGNPFQTVSFAAYYINNTYDANGSTSPTLFVVQMADNVTDAGGLHYSVRSIVGSQGNAAITIKGGTNSVLSEAQVYFSQICFENLTLQGTGQPNCLTAEFGAHVRISGVTFGNSASAAHINIDQRSTVIQYGAVTFAGTSGTAFAVIINRGTYWSAGNGITISANQTVSNAWLWAERGLCNFAGTTITNAFTVTGSRFKLASDSTVITKNADGDLAYFPGSSAGTRYGAHYDGAFSNTSTVSINSATTTDLGSTAIIDSSASVVIQGTVTITSFGSSCPLGSLKTLEFAGALTLTHNASTLIIPGAANITTVAGDCAVVRYEGGGSWRVISYTPAASSPFGTTLTATHKGPLDLSASGAGQIAFPASQNASAGANTLDDYEEGTWTPTIIGNVTAGVQTYVNQSGVYVKVGQVVMASGYVNLSAKGGTMAGTFCQVGGLPFAGHASGDRQCGVVSDWGGFTTGHYNVSLQLQGALTAAYIFGTTAAGSSGGTNATEITNGTYLGFSLNYRAGA
jgi:hypothetical protein